MPAGIFLNSDIIALNEWMSASRQAPAVCKDSWRLPTLNRWYYRKKSNLFAPYSTAMGY